MTERIEAQVERFAPGFRDLILARHASGPADLERRNRNIVGGDINGGTMDLRQLFFRPVRKLVPYRTPLDGLYICSSSTPAGRGRPRHVRVLSRAHGPEGRGVASRR